MPKLLTNYTSNKKLLEEVEGGEDVCVHAKSLQSCLTLCDPTEYSPPGSSVHEILQARIVEWVAMPSSRASSRPRDQTCFSYSGFFTTSTTWEAQG